MIEEFLQNLAKLAAEFMNILAEFLKNCFIILLRLIRYVLYSPQKGPRLLNKDW